MATFSLVIEYLTGYAVATDPSDRDRVEWPPHPARVYMALAAAHFETRDADSQNCQAKEAERAALEWLATLPAPAVSAPAPCVREIQTVYVPVNDQKSYHALTGRSKQPRTFPRAWIGTEPIRQTWSFSKDTSDRHLDALESLCRRVTRIGHSSSLVWMWLERNTNVEPTHVPDEHALEVGMRIVQPGAMKRMEENFNRSAIDAYTALEADMKSSRGKARKSIKARLEKQFPSGCPTSQRPAFPISCGYRPVRLEQPKCPATPFDPQFIVLRKVDNAPQTLGLESTAAITRALRGLLMKSSAVQPPPAWLSGHEPDGRKLESGHHMALIPLPFVGHHASPVGQHADGHLLGVGIVLPIAISKRERARCLGPALLDTQTNEPRTLELKMGRAGVWRVVRETGVAPQRALQTRTWTRPDRTWASVTPVLLDRMPKTKRAKDPHGWREEVADIIAVACMRQFAHLPESDRPQVVAVRTEKTPFFIGSLRAMPGQSGFPLLREHAYQVHCAVEFDREIAGPLLIGAGRFRGYGLMRPWKEEAAQ